MKEEEYPLYTTISHFDDGTVVKREHLDLETAYMLWNTEAEMCDDYDIIEEDNHGDPRNSK